MIIRKENNYFIIEFPYRKYLLDAVKKYFSTKRFDFSTKTWRVHEIEKAKVESFAKKFKFSFAEEEEDITIDYTVNALPELNVTIPLKLELYNYQKQGVAYGIEKERCLIGDKPGLGKTGQAIAAVTYHNAFPCLCITPPSPVPENWVDEWSKWTNKKVKIITPAVFSYMRRLVETESVHVFVVNYESLKRYFVDKIDKGKNGKFKLKDIHFNSKISLFKSVIVDESHRVSDGTRNRTKYVKGITNGKQFIYLLSGTSIVNKNKDLLTQLWILDRLNEFGGYKGYLSRYCAGQKESSNSKELNKKLTDICFYSRNKEDVLPDLPDKIRNIVYCDLDAASQIEYDAAARDLEGYMKQYKNATDEQVQKSMKGEVMVRIGILKDIAAKGKLAQVREYVNMVTENEKMGLFMLKHEIVDEMLRYYPGTLCITGRQTKEERVFNKNKFQQDENEKLIFLGLKTANEAITLTAASICGFVELPWHAAGADQCEDRFHRIGAKDSVRCTYFLARNTIDLWCYFEVIEPKRKNSNDVTGGNEDAVEINIVDSFIQFMDKQKEEKKEVVEV